MGAQLRRLREERKLSQEKLAELAGLHYKYVGRVELGKSDPGAYVLVRLAAALRVPIGELFEAVHPVGAADGTTHRLSPADADSIVDAASGLTALVNRILSRNKPSPLPGRPARRARR